MISAHLRFLKLVLLSAGVRAFYLQSAPPSSLILQRRLLMPSSASSSRKLSSVRGPSLLAAGASNPSEGGGSAEDASQSRKKAPLSKRSRTAIAVNAASDDDVEKKDVAAAETGGADEEKLKRKRGHPAGQSAASKTVATSTSKAKKEKVVVVSEGGNPPTPTNKRGGGRKKEEVVVVEEVTSTTTVESSASVSAEPKAPRPKVERATIPRSLTARQDLPNLPQGRRFLRLLSWNVAGLRGLMKKQKAVAAFQCLLQKERPDVLCLQETKLQDDHVAEVSEALKRVHLPQYEGNWYCSTAKKGYSGTTILISQDAGLDIRNVTYGIGQVDGDGEGRVITVDFGSFSLVNIYTPNSGEGLRRLDFRVSTWDRAFEAHLQQLQANGTPVIVSGDLNVAHLDLDFFNPHELRMKKAAGTTPEERASFGQLLQQTGMVDSFRHFHPDASGVYSYWSMRSGNRPYNRGMRLDYFLTTANMVADDAYPRLIDAFMLDQEPDLMNVSDHGPIGVVIAL